MTSLIFFTVVMFNCVVVKYFYFHCRFFASEQYFDSPGLFISVVFSTPMLFNCLIIIVSMK